MARYVRILEMDDKRILVGLLKDNGSCGAASCEGCSCGKKLPSMEIPLQGQEGLKVGMDVEMKAQGHAAADWFLLLGLPLLMLLGIRAIPFISAAGENLMNLSSLVAGLVGFGAGALILRSLRKNKSPVLIPVETEEPR